MIADFSIETKIDAPFNSISMEHLTHEQCIKKMNIETIKCWQIQKQDRTFLIYCKRNCPDVERLEKYFNNFSYNASKSIIHPALPLLLVLAYEFFFHCVQYAVFM